MPRAAAAPAWKNASVFFFALGDDTRLGVVRTLSTHGPLPMVKLAQRHDVTRQALAKHLAVLEAVGLVSVKKHGREKHYALESGHLEHAQHWLRQLSAVASER